MWVPYLAIATALTSLALSSTIEAQAQCTAPTANEWLRQPAASYVGAEIDEALIRRVDRNTSAAEALLNERSLFALDANQIGTFVSDAGFLRDAPRASRPYLVRAIFPTSAPKLNVRWSGADLHVFAGGLGCPRYTRQPLVIFLDREPTEIYVMASTAL